MTAEAEKYVTHIVADSSAFLRNAKLDAIAENVYTISNVLEEIKDKATKERLQVLPFKLNIVEPSSDSLDRVTAFAKKTGDYASLSAVDLRVLALTYELHVQHCGADSVRTEPQLKKEVAQTNSLIEKPTQIAGFYLPSKHESDDVSSPKVDTSAAAQESDESDSDDDDESGWITPSNISRVLAESGGGDSTAERVKVGCLTTDFAMQNVLLHMHLNVVAVDGLLIKRLKSYMLRCSACFHATSVMTKRFCPKCGNETLQKIAVTVAQDGAITFHYSRRKQPTTRGFRYSLPAPKGGKHAMNPILCEDQPMPENRLCRKAMQKLNVFDVDYDARTSPFLDNDVTSRSAVLGIRHVVHNASGTSRRNPNAGQRGKKRGGKKH